MTVGNFLSVVRAALKIRKSFFIAGAFTVVFLSILWIKTQSDAEKAVPVINYIEEPSTGISAAIDTIDINKATKEDLLQIDGIGQDIAENIIDYRSSHGKFGSVDELINVKGIGEKKLEVIKNYVYVEENENVSSNSESVTSISKSNAAQPTTQIQTTKADEKSSAETTASATTVSATTDFPETTAAQTPKVTYPIELNSATVDELMTLDGVGGVIAGRIVDYAKQNGFYSVDELINVNGIGEKKLAAIKPFVTVDTSCLPEKATAAENKNAKINLNTATVEELMTIKGIGEVTAAKIADYAKTKGFKSVDELLNIKGIGEKKLEEIRPYVCV